MAARQIDDTYAGYRTRLVEILRENGIEDISVLAAFARVPRHVFVPEALRARAYDDASLPIGHQQTISRPTTHARFLETLQLRGDEAVLEVGTGSGFQTGLLAFLARHVTSMERVSELAERARQSLRALDVQNAMVVTGDGTVGWRPNAPYDAIVVSAAGQKVPKPLLDQLAVGGQLLMPIDRGTHQVVARVRKTEEGLSAEELDAARFVPLIRGKKAEP